MLCCLDKNNWQYLVNNNGGGSKHILSRLSFPQLRPVNIYAVWLLQEEGGVGLGPVQGLKRVPGALADTTKEWVLNSAWWVRPVYIATYNTLLEKLYSLGQISNELPDRCFSSSISIFSAISLL